MVEILFPPEARECLEEYVKIADTDASADDLMGDLQRFDAMTVFEEDCKRKERTIPFTDWLREKLPQLVKNRQYAGGDLENFVGEKSNLEWMQAIARSLGARDSYAIDDLTQEVLVKFLITNHVEKFNPLKGPWKRHIFLAVKTTMISRWSRSTRSIEYGAFSLNETPTGRDDDTTWEISNERIGVNGKCSKGIGLSEDDPLNVVVVVEELEHFKLYLDWKETPLEKKLDDGGIKRTQLSEIWDWFWSERLTLEELCKKAGVRQSTMRRYFDKVRLKFIQFFGVDIPLRLWPTLVMREQYGDRSFSEKATKNFKHRHREKIKLG